MLTRGQIEIRVNRLLKKQSVDAPPVPIEKLAKELGAVIRSEPYDGDVSGALYRSGDTPVIGINALHATMRQRFTIAHEVGHLVLHDDRVHIDRHYLVDFPSETVPAVARRFLRDAKSSTATDQKEIEANRFAASILMPSRFLTMDLKKLTFPVNAKALESIAKRYRVSTQAMFFRLINLGIPVETT